MSDWRKSYWWGTGGETVPMEDYLAAELKRRAEYEQRPGDHARIASRLASLQAPWFMTYDNVGPIRSLYDGYPHVELDIGYSVQTKRRGSELLVAAKPLKLPFESAAAH